jgi:hypothetical protein
MIRSCLIALFSLAFALSVAPQAQATGWFSWGKKKETAVILGGQDTATPQTYNTHKPMAAPRAGLWAGPMTDKDLTPKDRQYLIRRMNDQTAALAAVRVREQQMAETRRLAVAAAAAQMAVRSKPILPKATTPQTPVAAQKSPTPAYRAPVIPVQDWDAITKGAQNPPAAAPTQPAPIQPIIIPNPNLRKKQADPPAKSGK